MTKRDRVLIGSMVACIACVVAGYSQSPPIETPVNGFTPGRLWATIDAVVGLIGAFVGGIALFRSLRQVRNGGRNGAIIAVVVGLIVIAYAVLHLSMFTGGLGTGGGRAGAFIAIAFGLISLILGGITVARFRRSSGSD